jgi:hypothetical protein
MAATFYLSEGTEWLVRNFQLKRFNNNRPIPGAALSMRPIAVGAVGGPVLQGAYGPEKRP